MSQRPSTAGAGTRPGIGARSVSFSNPSGSTTAKDAARVASPSPPRIVALSRPASSHSARQPSTAKGRPSEVTVADVFLTASPHAASTSKSSSRGGGNELQRLYEQRRAEEIAQAMPQAARPATAPASRKSLRTPFELVSPFMGRGEQLAAEQAHRTYSAGGKHRCPRNADFSQTPLAWGIGPGSYSLEKPEKHTPSYEYSRSETLQPELSAALKKISSRASASATDVEHIAPKKLKAHELRGPLISHKFAYSHVNHNREQLLKAALEKAVATPTVSNVYLLVPESSFSMKNSQQRGASIPVGDLGYRSRASAPHGPSLSDSLRPEWDKLATYVPPSVSGPSALIGSQFMAELDSEGKPMYSQSRLKELKEQGHKVNNFVEKNRFKQGKQTRDEKVKRINEVNNMISSKRERAKEFLQTKQREAWVKYEQSALQKDTAYRAEKRRLLQEQDDLIKLQKEWLRFSAMIEGFHVLHSLRESILRRRLQYFAAKKIWRFYKSWKQRCLEKVELLRQKKRPRSGVQPIAISKAHSSFVGSGRQQSFNLHGGLSKMLSEISPRGTAGGSISAINSPRSATSTDGGNNSPLKGADRGLNSLLLLQTNQSSAHILADFLDWALNDRFKKLKNACLTFRRRARQIQSWWRSHLLCQQWRLYVQTIQFLGFREKSIKQEAHERMVRAQEKLAAFNKNILQGTATSTGTGHRRKASLHTGSVLTTAAAQVGKRPPSASGTNIGPTVTRRMSHTQEEKTAAFYPSHHDGDDSDDESSFLPAHQSHVTFASSGAAANPLASLGSGGASLFRHGGHSPVRGGGGFRSDALAVEDRSSATKLAQRIWSHWLVVDEEEGNTNKRPLRKFPVPTKSTGSQGVLTWNTMILLQREVFNERLRRNRAAFKAWLKSMRIAGVREELLAHSGTVKPLTQEEKEKLERGETNIVLARANSLGSNAGEKLILDSSSDDESSSSSSSSDSDSNDNGEATEKKDRRSTPLTNVRRTRVTREAKRQAKEAAKAAAASRVILSRPRRREKIVASSFLSKLVPPSFFRLLLTDAELSAMHRAVNVLLASNPAVSTSHIHSAYFLTTKTLDESVNGPGVPIFIGQKYALRRAAQERAAGVAKEEREAAMAQAAAEEAERSASGTNDLPVGQLWPTPMRAPPVKGGTAGHVHLLLSLGQSGSVSAKHSPASSHRRVVQQAHIPSAIHQRSAKKIHSPIRSSNRTGTTGYTHTTNTTKIRSKVGTRA